MVSKNNKVYSLKWAWDVFEAFEKKHARATEIILIIYRLSTIEIVNMLRKDQERWRVFKKCVKVIESSGKVLSLPQDEHQIRTILTWVTSQAYIDLFPSDYYDRMRD